MNGLDLFNGKKWLKLGAIWQRVKKQWMESSCSQASSPDHTNGDIRWVNN